MGNILSYKRYEYIINNIKDVIWEIDKDYVFTFVSPNVKGMTGYEPEELVGRKLSDFLVEEYKHYVFNQVAMQLNNLANGNNENIRLHDVQFVCKKGSVKWIEVAPKPVFERGQFVGYIGTTRDITEKKNYENQLNKYISELKTLNAKLEKMATIDTLTGAYNRRKFDDDLGSIIERTKKYNTFSLVLFDIDNFKNINDNYGHKVGDNVLRIISRLVNENIRVTDGLFRWGGDEFILILPDIDLKNAKNVAEKLKNKINAQDFEIGHTITVSLSVGEYKPDENNDQLIIRIDHGLLEAKSKGKNMVVAC